MEKSTPGKNTLQHLGRRKEQKDAHREADADQCLAWGPLPKL